MKFIRVNMSEKAIRVEDVPQNYAGLGGRGLTSIMINAEVPPKCDPLGPENKLIFAPGLLSGTTLPNTSRLSIGAKSPLTGGIKESNSGGVVAYKLGRLGIKALKLKGRAKSESGPIGIRIDKYGIYFEDLAFLEGKTTYDSAAKLLEKWELKDKVEIELGRHSKGFIEDSDLVVLSPGVRIDSASVVWAREKKIPVIGEIELAWHFCSKPIVARTNPGGGIGGRHRQPRGYFSRQ